MSKELELLIKDICYKVNALHHKSINAYEILDTKEAKYIENALKENEALKSQVVGLENAYDKLADKCEKYYKALEIILSKKQLNTRSILLSKDYHYYKQFNLFKADNCDILDEEEYNLIRGLPKWVKD